MSTHLTFSNRHKFPLPEEFRSDDVRFSEEMAAHFITQYSKTGDVVFDPFTGFGTTLMVAEKLDRIGYGIEFDQKRLEYVRSLLKVPERAIHGDSTKLSSLQLPPINFSLTSPPYMNRTDRENPFTAYTTEGNGYEQYLADLRGIYAQIAQLMIPGASAVIEVSNLKNAHGVTTLAWDIALEVAKVLTFQGETVITWEGGYAYGYDHSYALVFQKP